MYERNSRNLGNLGRQLYREARGPAQKQGVCVISKIDSKYVKSSAAEVAALHQEGETERKDTPLPDFSQKRQRKTSRYFTAALQLNSASLRRSKARRADRYDYLRRNALDSSPAAHLGPEDEEVQAREG